MSNKLEIFKKRLIYRASYRGTKEMDMLLSAFVNKFIEKFDEEELIELEKFLNFEDEIIYNYYHYKIIKGEINKNKISKLFENFKLYGGEGGIRTHERVAPLLVFKTSAFNRSATSPEKINLIYYYQSH